METRCPSQMPPANSLARAGSEHWHFGEVFSGLQSPGCETMTRRLLFWLIFLSAGVVRPTATACRADDAPARPNIVWIFVDDMSANFSCYGETLIQTPNVDRLAREGTRFSRAFVTAPVCSPCRSALITGCYQTTIGAHHHRSGRGVEKIHLPQGVEPVPALFQRAGYYTCIGGPLGGKRVVPGKTDYNFEWDAAMYDGADWSGRRPDQPFFMQVELHGGKYRGGGVDRSDAWEQRVRRELGEPTSPEAVTLPPYYPRDPVLLNDWARYLDTVRYTDKEVGDVIARLENEGMLDRTVVFFMTDHGISHARGKQFLYDEGLHVPLVVRGPGIAAGKLRDDLVEHIDMAATSLALAGIDDSGLDAGANVLAADYQPRDAVFAARDRCDETVDHIRSVRTEHFKYIRNYLPQRPHVAAQSLQGRQRHRPAAASFARGRRARRIERTAALFAPAARRGALRPGRRSAGACEPGRRYGASLDPGRHARAAGPMGSFDRRQGTRGRAGGDVRQRHGRLPGERSRGAQGGRWRARGEHRIDEALGQPTPLGPRAVAGDSGRDSSIGWIGGAAATQESRCTFVPGGV